MSLGDISPDKLTPEESYTVISSAFACYLTSVGMGHEEMLKTMAKWCARVQEALPGRTQ